MAMLPGPSVLETGRLTLRRPSLTDAAVRRQLWTERDARVPAHRRIGPDGRPTEEDIVAYIREELAIPDTGLLTVVVKDTGDVVGYCGVVFHGNGAPDEPELAFELLRAVHNRGYATEAGRAVVAWVGGLGHRRLWATVWDWNVASRRVLEKLGFVDTGQVVGTSVHGRSLLTVRENAGKSY